MKCHISRVSLFLLLLSIFYIPLFAKKKEICYSVQLLSGKNIIKNLQRFPLGSRLMYIGGLYTIRNGCYATVEKLKKDFQKLSKGFDKAIIVSTYRYRFHTKMGRNSDNIFDEEDLTPCLKKGCRPENRRYAWEGIDISTAKKLLHVEVAKPLIEFKKSSLMQRKTEIKDGNSTTIPDMLLFYINPYFSLYSGQTRVGGERLYKDTEKLSLGFKYLHYFDLYWYFYTDMRVIPYRTAGNSGENSGVSFDVNEFYLISDRLYSNQLNFLIGRKILKDSRSWYYNDSLDTIGVFNKHDLLLYSLYFGTRLDSNIITDGSNSSKYDLRGTDFFIAHLEYEYFVGNKVGLFGLYEHSSDVLSRKLAWLGFRAEGDFKSKIPNFTYWFDVAKVSGSTEENSIYRSIDGMGLDIGVKYDFENQKDSISLSFAYGSGGNHLYLQPHLTNNRSDYLAKNLNFRYYGSFFNPELSNIKISSFYYIHKFENSDYTALLALHNYQQVEASSKQYIATNYTVNPNGNSLDLGSEIDFVFGAYFQKQYSWHLELAYFLGGDAFDDVASKKDGVYGNISFRYYW